MKFGKGVVKCRFAILIAVIVLLIPAAYGMTHTRINYDMLTYLPSQSETVIGQEELREDFGKGAFSFLIFENMPYRDVAKLEEQIKEVDHVDTVLWYDDLMDLSVPVEILPDEIYEAFNNADGTATMMAIFFDSGTSEDVTMDAVREIRQITGEKVFVSGMTAMVLDLKDLCEKEEPVYVALAVLCAVIAMELLLDGWLVPFVFLASIGACILINLGTNRLIFGEISYITKALAAVLQLAVTMDYSIFLWHSYNEQRRENSDPKEAMAKAIHLTLSSVLGSSITTIAGFIALCFMSFTLGKDLGLVMAKGVVIGVIGCVTFLPALILILDKPLQKTRHKSLIPNCTRLAKGVLRFLPVFLILFAAVLFPAVSGYRQTNQEVYYDMGSCLPEDIAYVSAQKELQTQFDVSSTHMVLIDSNVSSKEVREMCEKMEQVDGVKYVLGLDSVIGAGIPDEVVPDEIRENLESDRYKLILINSSYRPASDEVNDQIDELNALLKAVDPNGMLIGEAPCMKDMIDTTSVDFQVVNTVSIAAIFVIIMLVEKSISLPILLIAVIELAIFINLALAHYTGVSLPFIAPIIISTIQLGATVDYAILMTTRYKQERLLGEARREAVETALAASIPSILVSGAGLFAATFGVSIYSDIDLVASMCSLMARGALISMVCVIFLLPCLLYVADPVIVKTTLDLKRGVKKTEEKPAKKKRHTLKQA